MHLKLPLDLQLSLFDTMITPILIYGCEIWGTENVSILEKLHLKYCKYVLGVSPSTTTCMVYGETGRMPISVIIQLRLVSFWARLITSEEHRLRRTMYSILLKHYNDGTFVSPWLRSIKNILDSCGFSHIWETQTFPSQVWIVNAVKLRLRDQWIQQWRSDVMMMNKCVNYRIFKTELCFENYLIELPYKYRKALAKLRMSNHKLPVEKGRYERLPLIERKCRLCNDGSVGDEFHFLLQCKELLPLRKRFIPVNYWRYPNTLNFNNLMNDKRKSVTLRIAKFCYEGFKLLL